MIIYRLMTMSYRIYKNNNKNNIEWICVNFYKNIKLIIVGFFLLNNSLQYSSEGIESDVAKENIVPSPTQKAFLRQRRKSFSIDVEPVKISSLRPVMVTGDDIMRQVLLRTYDADVIDLWMNRYDLDRIAMHAKMQNTTSLALLKTLVDMSSDLKNNKNKIMDDLYASEKIRLTSGYDKKSEAIFIIACDADKNKNFV